MWFISLCIQWCLWMNECLSGGKVALIYYGSVALTFTVRQIGCLFYRRSIPGNSVVLRPQGKSSPAFHERSWIRCHGNIFSKHSLFLHALTQNNLNSQISPLASLEQEIIASDGHILWPYHPLKMSKLRPNLVLDGCFSVLFSHVKLDLTSLTKCRYRDCCGKSCDWENVESLQSMSHGFYFE